MTTVNQQCGEVWRAIPGWEGRYEVSTLGRVRSVPRYICKRDGSHIRAVGFKILKGRETSCGHLKVRLCRDGSGINAYVHQLVLAAFVGPKPPGKTSRVGCRHLNGDGKDNRLENLCWGTQQENVADSVRHGTRVKNSGHRNPAAKLSVEEVEKIRYLCASGAKRSSVAAQFGVHYSTVSRIVSGKSWLNSSPKASDHHKASGGAR